MKIGAEPKKLGALGLLMLVLGYFLYTNVIAPGPEAPNEARSRAPRAPAAKPNPVDTVSAPAPAAETRPRPPLRPGASSQVRFNAKDTKIDPTTIDPTLRLDLLAKVQSVNMEGGDRNLFQFGAAPPPKTPDPKVIPKPVGAKAAEETNKPPAQPEKPPPPPIPLKFYGYTSVRTSQKRAFFLDGDDIVVAPEGSTIKNRYKVVRIGVNSVVVEDTQFQHQQTLPLEEQTG